VICQLSGSNGATVDCDLHIAAANGVGAGNFANAMTYYLYYDPAKYSFSGLSCPIFNGAVNTCADPQAPQLIPTFGGGSGATLTVNSNPAECDDCLKILMYTTTGIALSSATVDAGGSVNGNSFIMHMQFTLAQSLTNEPVYVELSDASDSSGNLLYLGVDNMTVITGGVCNESNSANCIQ